MKINDHRVKYPAEYKEWVRSTVRIPKGLRDTFRRQILKDRTFNAWLVETMEKELKK